MNGAETQNLFCTLVIAIWAQICSFCDRDKFLNMWVVRFGRGFMSFVGWLAFFMGIIVMVLYAHQGLCNFFFNNSDTIHCAENKYIQFLLTYYDTKMDSTKKTLSQKSCVHTFMYMSLPRNLKEKPYLLQVERKHLKHTILYRYSLQRQVIIIQAVVYTLSDAGSLFVLCGILFSKQLN